ncbi:MAG: DUF4920 domain-containing protein [Flavobacterium sp.]|nr:DUF4920 domain-containing protein [Flavobacterium sp.]
MKKINLLVFLVILTTSFTATAQTKSKTKNTTSTINAYDYALFGEKFSLNNILTKDQMLKKYKSLKKGDSLAVKFTSKIKEVCKKKGCWMQMDLNDKTKSFVRFKDYGFFVPLNAADSQGIVSGIAFIDVVTVDELKHYAKDAGKSKEEINKITKPEITYAFKASGVYIKK